MHHVVPVVMMTEGVLNGTHGPLMYEGQDMKQSANHWNGKPVVVMHPDMTAGGYAANPQVFNRQKIGTVFNATYDAKSKKLKAEAWIDPERAAKVDPRVLDAIKKNKMMELSTGLTADTEDKAGVYNGRQYKAIARNYRPDHLAILPDQIGASSIKDGSGFMRANVALVQPLALPSLVC